MHRLGRRSASRALVAAVLVLPVVAGCGGSDDKDAGSTVSTSPEPLRTAVITPTDAPRKQTSNIERGTTSYVGGLRLGVMSARAGTGTIAVLAGPDVPEDGDWTVSGKAGHSKKLANGFTVIIDEVTNARGSSDATGSAGGSVTVTVVPPSA